MKRLLRLTIIIFVFILLTAVFSGCSDPIPTGEWEGNYLYIANTRMKTDGTDREVLLTSFIDDDGTEYELNQDNYFQSHFYGQYMFIHVPYPRFDERELTGYALVVYDMENKTSFFAASTGPHQEKCVDVNFYKAFEDYFVVERQNPDGMYYRYDYMSVDYSGNVINEDDTFFLGAKIFDRDVFHYRDREVTYSTIDDRAEIHLFDCDEERFIVIPTEHPHVYVINDNVVNPLTNKVVPIADPPSLSWTYYGNYFITSKNMIFSQADGFDLWKINEDCTCELIFTLSKEYSIKTNGISADERYIHFVGTANNTKYTYNKKTNKFYKGDDSYCNDIGDKYGCTKGIRCGDYYYNVYYAPGIIFGSHPNYFYRFNSKSKTTEVLNIKELTGNGNPPPQQTYTIRPY